MKQIFVLLSITCLIMGIVSCNGCYWKEQNVKFFNGVKVETIIWHGIFDCIDIQTVYNVPPDKIDSIKKAELIKADSTIAFCKRHHITQ